MEGITMDFLIIGIIFIAGSLFLLGKEARNR
jgi:hypothetical protein